MRGRIQTHRTRGIRPWAAAAAAILVLLVGACGGAPEVSLPSSPTEVASPPSTPAPPTATPPPSELIVCLADEPGSLYLYGDISPAADVVLEAIYDGPVDLSSFRPEPVLLEKTPSLADGDATIGVVTIAAGDVYLDPVTFQPAALDYGMPYLPTSCRSADCVETYSGGQVDVDQMTVRFELQAGLQWSDGEPLTADDSVFSYQVDGNPETPTPKYLYARTYSYRALDETTLEWVGIPGFLDPEYATNVWTPLPEHVLADTPVSELATNVAAAEEPLGWGPYALDHWDHGTQLVMRRNPYYRLADQGLPGFDSLVFRFLSDPGTAIDQLRSGECDVLDEALIPLDQLEGIQAAIAGQPFTLALAPGAIVDRMDFNLQPVEGADHAGILAEADTRRALAGCIDRDGLARQLFGDAAVVPATFLPPDHPDYIPGEDAVAFDPAAAQQALDEIGWVRESSEAAVRTANGVPGVVDGTSLEFTLRSLTSGLAQSVAEAVRADLDACGVRVDVESRPAAELFAAWPDGPVFGRRFDAVTWAWPAFSSPPCEMFASWEIPSDERPNGINASGYQDGAYDAACTAVLLSPPETPAHDAAVRAVQAAFVESVPALPLVVRPRALAFADWVCGVQLDPTTVTELWDLEQLAPCP